MEAVTALNPTIITVFGITGDLASRKLLPALYHLSKDGLLLKNTRIVGITRSDTTSGQIIDSLAENLESNKITVDQTVISWLKEALTMVSMDPANHEQYSVLKTVLDGLETEQGICMERIFYLAIPSTSFATVVDRLGMKDLNTGCQHGKSKRSKLLIEKPFGYDLKSAEELIEHLKKSFHEDQIYRIDHYLAKETVQNIMTFRTQNALFRQSWSNAHISHIAITATESIGIEGRVSFYEQMGALRDLIQSHLLQLVALTTMEEPESLHAVDMHKAKETLLGQIRPPSSDTMQDYSVRAQYDSYQDEVSTKSAVETFAAIKFTIDNDRWKNVPILIRTGKMLDQKATEICVVYHQEGQQDTNVLTLRLQPNEGIVLQMRIKKPGFTDEVQNVQMDFCYNEHNNAAHPDAYERVLIDALKGDHTLFATSEEVRACWRITQPILDAWEANKTPLHTYENGSEGPIEASKLAERCGIIWDLSGNHICRVHPTT